MPVGTTLEQAEEILHEHRVEKLLVVDDKYNLKGLITVKDIQKKLKYPAPPKTTKAVCGWARAIGATGDFLERAQELAKAKVDVLAIDSAHGHSSLVLEAVQDGQSEVAGSGSDRRQRGDLRRRLRPGQGRSATASKSASGRARSAPRAS